MVDHLDLGAVSPVTEVISGSVERVTIERQDHLPSSLASPVDDKLAVVAFVMVKLVVMLTGLNAGANR